MVRIKKNVKLTEKSYCGRESFKSGGFDIKTLLFKKYSEEVRTEWKTCWSKRTLSNSRPRVPLDMGDPLGTVVWG